MRRPIRIRIVQDFPHPPEAAYAWLTDFDDGDTQRTDAVIKARRVVERGPTRVVYEGETEALGRRAWARTEVTLMPPDKWHARVTEGPRTGSETHYRLEALPGGGSRAIVEYGFVFVDGSKHLIVRLAAPLLRKSLQQMWAGFARSMDEELRITQGAAAAAPSA